MSKIKKRVLIGFGVVILLFLLAPVLLAWLAIGFGVGSTMVSSSDRNLVTKGDYAIVSERGRNTQYWVEKNGERVSDKYPYFIVDLQTNGDEFSYIVNDGRSFREYQNGQSVREFAPGAGRFRRSPDDEHLTYATGFHKEQLFWLDDDELDIGFMTDNSRTAVFSPDSSEVAVYGGKISEMSIYRIDTATKRIKSVYGPYRIASDLNYSADSKHVFYWSKNSGNETLIKNGEEIVTHPSKYSSSYPSNEKIQLSRDGALAVFPVRLSLYINDKEIPFEKRILIYDLNEEAQQIEVVSGSTKYYYSYDGELIKKRPYFTDSIKQKFQELYIGVLYAL